jgi:hypothetical protein
MDRVKRRTITKEIRKFLLNNPQINVRFIEREAKVSQRTVQNIADGIVLSTNKQNLKKLRPVLEACGMDVEIFFIKSLEV